MKVTVNPDVQNTSFESVKAGTYLVTIKEIKDRNPAKNDLEIRYEHVAQASELPGLDGEPIKGQPSGLYDYVMLAPDKQWKLRQLVEAAGLMWNDFDTDDLVGTEVMVQIIEDNYQGSIKNKIKRYVNRT